MPVMWRCSGCGEEFSSEDNIAVHCPNCRELIDLACLELQAIDSDIWLEDGMSNVKCPECSFPPFLDTHVKERKVYLMCRGCGTTWSMSEITDVIRSGLELKQLFAMKEADEQ